MNWVTILGLILIAIGTILTYLGKDIANKQTNRELNTKIDNLSSQNERLSEENKKTHAQNSELATEVKKYQDENKRLRDNLREEKAKTFDLGEPSEKGGITLMTGELSRKKHYRHALEEFERGNFIDTKEELELILKRKPDDPNVLNALGLVLYKMGNKDDSVQCLERAYELSQDPDILRNIEVVKKYPPDTNIETRRKD